MKRTAIVVVGLLLLVAAWLAWEKFSEKPAVPAPPPPVVTPVEVIPVDVATKPVEVPVVVETVPPPPPPPVVHKKPKKTAAVKPIPVVAPVAVNLAPPPVEIHKELIPKNIEIVRVYYASGLMGPGSTTEFDINGTGFTKEFERMITVESGNPQVQVQSMKYVTLNQIHGVLVVSPGCSTSVGFPQVLINGKVVFRAAEPYAVIRPGEVLNVIFTEMGESGRSGKFRIYTNLTQDTYPQLSVAASTPSIQVTELKPQLPFIVDATLQIGPALVGEYGLIVKLGGKTVWERGGAVRIVQPEMTEPGLAQRIRATDGFYRPKDLAKFIISGSGFQPRDAELLQVNIPGWGVVPSTWTFVAPGRLDCAIVIPANAAVQTYDIQIKQDEKMVLNAPQVFSVVPGNWLKSFRIDPPLQSGKTSALILEGRDFTPDFASGLKATFDDNGLQADSFVFMEPKKIVGAIKAADSVSPGDYLITLQSKGTAVNALNGNVIRVVE